MSYSNTISPSELASVIGVSRQTVYNRMTKDLSKFVKEIDGKKRLDIAVLEHLGVNQNVKEPSPELDSIVKALTHELDVKNEQIKALTQQNAELTAALQTTTQSLLAAQALHASSVQQLSDGSTHQGDQGDTKKHWWNSFHRKKTKNNP